MESLEVTEKLLFECFYNQEKASREQLVLSSPTAQDAIKQFQQKYGVCELGLVEKEKIHATKEE